MFTWLDQNWPNWKITLAALFTAVCIALQDAYNTGTLHKTTILVVLGMAVVGFFAKGRNVTGGSVPQTREARLRAEKTGSQTGLHRVGVFVLAAILVTGFNGCAAKHATNPDLSRQTVTQLNLADQLQLLQHDYIQFFTDVGIAQRAGQLSTAEVTSLNSVGDRLKLVIERGNRAYKDWEVNQSNDSLHAIVIAALQEGTGLLLDLTSQRAELERHHRGGKP
jgi:hypothetical protein